MVRSQLKAKQTSVIGNRVKIATFMKLTTLGGGLLEVKLHGTFPKRDPGGTIRATDERFDSV